MLVGGVPYSGRKGYIDKETDTESSLGDFSARKYDDWLGRFTSIDPLWEEYRGLSPYHYSANSPLIFLDPSGLVIIYSDNPEEKKLQMELIEAVRATDAGKKLVESAEAEGVEVKLVFGTLQNARQVAGFKPKWRPIEMSFGTILSAEYQGGTITIDKGKFSKFSKASQVGIMGHELFHQKDAQDDIANYINRGKQMQRQQIDYFSKENTIEEPARKVQRIIQAEYQYDNGEQHLIPTELKDRIRVNRETQKWARELLKQAQRKSDSLKKMQKSK